MGKRGPQPDDDHAKRMRNSQRVSSRRKDPHLPKLRLAKEVDEIPILDPRESIMLVPGYDPWRDAEGYEFDEEKARRAVEFFHKDLTHVKGAKARTPFYLEPWEQAIIANLFGWVDKDTGFRRYQECLLYVPRKNGKTIMAAGIVLFLTFMDDETGAEVYGAASEYKQASLVFDHARGMVEHNPELLDRCTVYKGQAKAIQLGAETDYSTYRVISADAGSAHGFSAHGAVIDELHTHNTADLFNTLQTSTGTRDQPLIVSLTTADYDRESLCNEKHDYACKVRDGVVVDPRFLPIVYEVPQDADWTSPKVWAEANPNLGVSLKLEYLQRECQRAQVQPTYENTFKRLHLNMKTEQDVRWLSLAQWDACGGEVLEADLQGCECFAGLDLSSTTDVTALSLMFPDDDGGYVGLFRFWIPAANAVERERRDRVPYETWGRQGLMDTTPGNVVDYDRIRVSINELKEQYDIREIAIDRWNSTHLQRQLMDDGFEIVPFGQGYASMSSPTKELERLVIEGAFRHGDHPVLRWMAGNVMVEMDSAGNLKPAKDKSTEKIDGIVATVMALGRAMVAERVEEPQMMVV